MERAELDQPAPPVIVYFAFLTNRVMMASTCARVKLKIFCASIARVIGALGAKLSSPVPLRISLVMTVVSGAFAVSVTGVVCL